MMKFQEDFRKHFRPPSPAILPPIARCALAVNFGSRGVRWQLSNITNNKFYISTLSLVFFKSKNTISESIEIA